MPKVLFPLLILSMLALSSCGNSGEQNQQADSPGRIVEPTHTVNILTEGRGEIVVDVNVALAQTDRERSAGLMEVRDLPFDTGMFFIFDEETHRSFWMVNTPLSLDILFLNRDFEIIRIHTQTTPYSDRQLRSGAPAKYVLEVNAGFVREYDIREGMYAVLE